MSYHYHYTDEAGMKGILESGHIRPSTDTTRDAVLGEGVYFTQLRPNCPNDTLTSNNYGEAGTMEEKTQFYFRIPTEDLPPGGHCVNEGGRNLCVAPGPIHLSEVKYVVKERKRY